MEKAAHGRAIVILFVTAKGLGFLNTVQTLADRPNLAKSANF